MRAFTLYITVALCCLCGQHVTGSVYLAEEKEKPINNLDRNTVITNLLRFLSTSDAPKFYALNAQLYNSNNKQATSQNSAPDLRPLDGARIIPSDGTVGAVEADDDGVDGGKSSIDSLIKAMRRRQMMMSSTDGRTPLEGPNTARDEDDGENGGADGGGGDATAKGVMMNQPRRAGAGSGLSDEDEASIQRKSTKLAAADEQEEDGDEKAASVSNGASSRLRRNGKSTLLMINFYHRVYLGGAYKRNDRSPKISCRPQD